MGKRKQRTFTPTQPTTVVKWVWVKGYGLKCHYGNGLVAKSAWGTLREFLKAVKEGREVKVVES